MKKGKIKYYITFTYGFFKSFGRIPLTDKDGKILLFNSKNQVKDMLQLDIFGEGWLNYYSKIEKAILK